MKNASMLKFNQRHVNDGVIVNLSIINDENLVIKIDSGEYIEEPTIVHDVRHEMLNEKLEKKEYFEDLLLPGYFDVDVFAGNTKKFHLYFNDEDFRVDTINFDEVLSNYFYRKSKAVSNIADEFVELKDLAMLVDNFSFEDSIITTLPYPSIFDYSMTHCYEESIKKFENDLKILIDVVKSIEGQYIVFDKLKEANKLDAKGFNVEIVYDWEQSFLENKDAPIDKGREIWNKLYRNRKNFNELKEKYLKKGEKNERTKVEIEDF